MSNHIHINRPPPANRLHECTMTAYLEPWPDMTPTVVPPLRTANQLAWCHKCRRRRRAKNLMVVRQEWYDPMVYCADGCAEFKKKRNAQARRRYARKKKD